MATVGKGSKLKFVLAIEGLADAELGSFKIDFYAKEKKESRITAYYTAEYSGTNTETVFYNETDDNYSIIVDTAELDTGTIGATLEVTYTDEGTNTALTEILTLSSNVVLTNAPQSPEEEQVQEEEPVEQQGE